MADLDDETNRNLAASLIQTRFREYRKRCLEAEQAALGVRAGDAADIGGDVELTDEEKREFMVAKIQQLYEERKALITKNLAQQRQLAKQLADRRSGQPDAAASEGLTTDADAEYWKTIAKLRNDRAHLDSIRNDGHIALEAFKEKHEATLQKAAEEDATFRDYVRQQAGLAVFPRNNKPIPPKRIEEFMAEDQQLYDEIHAERVHYIKLRNRAERISKALRSREKQNNGMHMIDFEQLKIENTNLNEKIEERNEDLLKLRKKATTTIHVLTHVKEKLEFVKAENTQLQRQVAELEQLLADLREKLTQTKKDRDLFVNENVRMKEKMPMIGSEDLLLDYEQRKKQIEDLRMSAVTLNNEHTELMQWISAHQSQLDKLQKMATSA